eukprot:3711520-Pyramimonas_sp.AAC.1
MHESVLTRCWTHWTVTGRPSKPTRSAPGVTNSFEAGGHEEGGGNFSDTEQTPKHLVDVGPG